MVSALDVYSDILGSKPAAGLQSNIIMSERKKCSEAKKKITKTQKNAYQDGLDQRYETTLPNKFSFKININCQKNKIAFY